MTVVSEKDRVAQLVQTASKNSEDNNLQEAFKALQEASLLDPQDQHVKIALANLRDKESTVRLVDLTRRFLDEQNESNGERALRALQTARIQKDEAVEALSLLLDEDGDAETLDRFTGRLLVSSLDARKSLASRLHSNATLIFDKLFARGPDSFKALTGVSLEDAAWTVQDDQKASQRDVFQLCIAKLMYVSVGHPERAMRAVARQVAVSPNNVREAIDQDIVDVILGSLDIRNEVDLRSQAILATSKVLELTGEAGEGMFAHFITTKVAEQTNDDLVIAFSAASAVFPIVPGVAAKLFLTDGFVQQLVPTLERNSEAENQRHRKSTKLERAALELLSAACVNKACREAIQKHCSSWLENVSEEREGIHKALAALVLAKIDTASQNDITRKLAGLVINGDGERDQAVEGLAYTSLRPSIKEQIVSDAKLLKTLIDGFAQRHDSAFGYLTLFLNLAAYKPVQSEEQKKMSQLKAYANSTKPEPDDPLDDDAHVTARAKKLLDENLVPALVSFCKQTSSLANISLVVRLLLSMSKEHKHRAKMAQQSAVRLLLQIRDRIAKTDKATEDASLIERLASHALARLLISVNPAHVFSSGLSATSAVSAIVPLLQLDHDSEQRDLLPTFEGLLALTNLASMEDDSARDLQIRTAFDKVEDLMFSSNTLVQQASVELVCNLMMSPSGVAKFADGSHDAGRRMQILLALTDVDNMATRRAAGGAVAMLTEWDAAVKAILDREKGIKPLLEMCADENDEVKHRGFVCLSNVINMPGDLGTRAIKNIKATDGTLLIKDALKTTRNPEVLTLGVDVLKKIG